MATVTRAKCRRWLRSRRRKRRPVRGSVGCDLSEYRGTGGVLRELGADFADDDLLLVANAAQVLLDPLIAVATALDRKEGDFTLVSHSDGTPSGVMLLSCKTLRMIPETG